VTHVLLPVLALLRRLDLAAVIVEALVARHLEGAEPGRGGAVGGRTVDRFIGRASSISRVPR
jgi:hypothetical protein